MREDERCGSSAESLEDLSQRERDVVEAEIHRTGEHATVVREKLLDLAGTPWARAAINSALARGAIEQLIAGRDPKFASPLDAPAAGMTNLKYALRGGGEEAIYTFLTGRILAHPDKPGNALNGSFLDCTPSRACAHYCYATTGRAAMRYNVVRAELVTMAVERDPGRAADLVASEYASTLEYHAGKALRLFDRGDGSPKWHGFVRAAENKGLRFQVFSRRQEFLSGLSDYHLRLLSVDAENMIEAGRYPQFPFAFVYTGAQREADFLNTHKEHIGVVLPLARHRPGDGKSYVPPELLALLDKEVQAYICPVDKGAVAINPAIDVRDAHGALVRRFSLTEKRRVAANLESAGLLAERIGGKVKRPNRQDWRCTDCDASGGLGCFHGRSSAEVAVTAGVPSLALRAVLEEIHGLARNAELAKYLSAELARVVREVRGRGFSRRKEEDDRRTETTAGSDGRRRPEAGRDGGEGARTGAELLPAQGGVAGDRVPDDKQATRGDMLEAQWEAIVVEKIAAVRTRAAGIEKRVGKDIEQARLRLFEHGKPNAITRLTGRARYAAALDTWTKEHRSLEKRERQLQERGDWVHEYTKEPMMSYSTKGMRLAERQAERQQPRLAQQVREFRRWRQDREDGRAREIKAQREREHGREGRGLER